MRSVGWNHRLALAAAIGAVLAAAGACDDDPSSTGGGGAATAASTTSATTVSSSTGAPLPETFQVSGIVTDGTAPVPGAIVMQGGGEPAAVSAPDGSFTITMTTTLPGTPTLVAAKIGYRAAGEEIYALPTAPFTLVLRAANPPDNVAYVYGDPGVGDATLDNNTSKCGHCHTTYVADFQTSAHSRATRDPLVQDLYAGVASAIASSAQCAAAGGTMRTGTTPGTPGQATSRCYVGAGVLPDLNACGSSSTQSCDDPALAAGAKPTAFGACADCHAAGLDGVAGGRDLLDSKGIGFQNGNHCDTCHHARDVDPSSTVPGVGGALVMQRPHEKESAMPGAKPVQVMFGPLPDVPNGFMGGSYQPVFTKADFCAACHEYKQAALLPGATLDPTRWPDRLPILSTYSEWSDSAFGAQGTPCQACHMPAKVGLTNSIDVTKPDDTDIAFGFARTPEQLHAHIFRDPLEGTPRLIDEAIMGGITAAPNGASLDVEVALQNIGAGHAIPTGEPMRSLVLAVRVDGCGQSFAAIAGPTIPAEAGALASGFAGSGVTFGASSVDWAAAAPLATPGDVVRVVRPTGSFLDYPGIGFFADPGLSAAEKGIEIANAIGEATVLSVNGTTLALSASPSAQPGNLVFLGSPSTTAFLDGAPSRALAGAPGRAFARVMVDPGGARMAPHHRANDIASDDRLPPGAVVTTGETFAIPPGCTAATVTATLLYRPLPWSLAEERAWDARDWVVFETTSNVVLP